MTELFDAKMKAEQQQRKLEKEMLEDKHKAVLAEKDQMLANHDQAAASAKTLIQDLQAKLEAQRELAAECKAKAALYEGMYQLQKNDHERMFEAMLAKMNRD